MSVGGTGAGGSADAVGTVPEFGNLIRGLKFRIAMLGREFAPRHRSQFLLLLSKIVLSRSGSAIVDAPRAYDLRGASLTGATAAIMCGDRARGSPSTRCLQAARAFPPIELGS